MNNGHEQPDARTVQDTREQAVTVDVQDEYVRLLVRGKYDLRPTEVILPFPMLDLIYLQKLNRQIQKAQQAAGVARPAQQAAGVVRPT